MFVKPPVGRPSVDDFYVSSFCNECNKHFLIEQELEMHKKNGQCTNIEIFLVNPKLNKL